MRAGFLLGLVCAVVLAIVVPAPARQDTLRDRVEELQQELDSLVEDVDDLREPVAEFDLFDQCMYLIGVSEHGRAAGASGYVFGADGRKRRRAVALDMRGFGRPARYQFLAFPGEEPPSIECNEDAGQEETDG